MTTMTQSPPVATASSDVTEKLRKIQELHADAPQVAKDALANAIRTGGLAKSLMGGTQSGTAGRHGRREGKVSELTLVAPFARGGAQRLRGLLKLLDGSFRAADLMNTVHDMRFVFLENDTRLLFATTYDGDWDVYIEDFAAQVPDALDLVFSAIEGWPGMKSPQVKDAIAKYQVTAEGWYVASPDLTVAEERRLQKVGGAVQDFLDELGE